jgi:two-component system aerobic respiration control sensor histidine kinase ArcB
MLDLQTLSISSLLAATISALFFIIVWRLNHLEKGVSTWLVALIMQAAGITLLSFRGYLNEWLSIICANYFLILSFLLFLIGTRKFFGHHKHHRIAIAVHSGIFFPTFFYLTFVEPNLMGRISIVYLSFLLSLVGCIYTVLTTPKAQSKAGYIFTFICACFVTLIIARLVTSNPTLSSSSLYDLNLGNFIGAVTGLIFPYGATLSFFLLCTERKVLEVKDLQRSAQKEIRLKNHLLASLSHELRTPLNGMIGKAQLMKPHCNKKQQLDLDIIIQSGQALSELSSKVLVYAAQNSDTPATTLSNTHMPSLINQLIETVSTQASIKLLRLNVNIDKNMPDYLHVDTFKLRLVLINLLSNAIKYTDHGHVTVDISLTEKSATGVSLKVSVSDSGIGIPLLDQGDLLEPFMRASNVINKREGTGLGLSLAQGALQAMGSSLEFMSRENKGSVFYFYLSASVGEKRATTQKTHTVSVLGLNILLVEDIQLNIDVVTSMLEKQQHNVTSAKTLTQAVQLSQEQCFDLILLDMQLPDGHGLQLLERLKNTVTNNLTPVIAITAALTPRDILKYEASSLSAVVEKPIIESRLQHAISDVCSHQTFQVLESSPLKSKNVPFDKNPFQFLADNLSDQELATAIKHIPSTINQYLNLLHSALLQGDQTEQEKSLHKLASYGGQFGLMTLSKLARQYEQNLPKNPNDCCEALRGAFNQSMIGFNQHIKDMRL